MAWFYAVGMVFGVSAAAILLNDLVKLLTGHATEADLSLVKESEERGVTIVVFLGSLLGGDGARHPDRVRAARLRRRADVAPGHVRRRRSWRRT